MPHWYGFSPRSKSTTNYGFYHSYLQEAFQLDDEELAGVWSNLMLWQEHDASVVYEDLRKLWEWRVTYLSQCDKCNRAMGYNPQRFNLCAPCELGFT